MVSTAEDRPKVQGSATEADGQEVPMGPGEPDEWEEGGPGEPDGRRLPLVRRLSRDRRRAVGRSGRGGPDGTRGRSRGRVVLDDAGMATAEYAIATVAAAGFAGLLIAILRSDEVRGLLLGIVRGALSP